MKMETTIKVNISSTVSASLKEDSFQMDYTVEESAAAAATLLIIMIVCLVGNAVICYVVIRNRRMWTGMNMFLVNLATGDIAMSLLSMTTPLQTAIVGEWTFGSGPICQLNAFCNSVLFCNTIFTHAAISIERFFAVVKPMKKIMTRRKALSAILGVWTIAVVISLGPLLGWGRNAYNASTLQCGYGFPRDKVESFYIICLAVFAFLLPIVIMSYAYIRIYLAVRHHTRRLSTSTFGNHQHAVIKEQRRTVLTFFLALIVFVICWTPFFVFIAVAVSSGSRDELPHGLGIAAYWCGFLNSAVNPYLIGLRSERFYEAFKHLFCCLFNCFKSDAKQHNEGKYSSAKTDRNTETEHCVIQQTISPQNGQVNSRPLVNMVAEVTETDAAPSRERKERSKKQESKDAVAYPHFIHMVYGKLWTEATV